MQLETFNTDVGEMEELDIDIEAILEGEIKRKVIGRLKNEKAVLNDELRTEIIKYRGETLVKAMTKLCYNISTTDKVPEAWRYVTIIPIATKDAEEHGRSQRTKIREYAAVRT